ncbi:sigma-70 region 4 domain-containing protein [Escherichia coli]|uniref:helix-turn-helix transcriptional regulator n=2 Tax=Escherichia TaxID=561 RepID=UPI00077FD25F|nr:sigma factor-like helix-turn-helix DNA-binding protein [Escherichia coli]EFO3600849.1 sigma-70 family RNA polymerase sigma factor [Escherichia coli]EIP2371521.1 sigma-70 region 4 domain-containing protein [Escherichia coli]EKH4184442.1 sigma-70 region 4 domain-containing protein [Escherichia coli]HAW1246985.1 sigma-70 family RNA polymerase sigma factor [Escherichia coli]HAW2833163.1 sigma-70 family RNA polymerase sigma factor [Escherichia coli]
MNIIIVTHNKYLELGLKKLLSRHSITIGADFFIPDNREHIIHNDVFVILCDKKNSMLMSYIFNGYKFHLLPVESISSLSSIYDYIFSGRLLFGYSPHKLTMNEMIILFYYVFHGCNVASIAYQFGISSKTVYTHIYRAKKKNGIPGENLKYKCAYERFVC